MGRLRLLHEAGQELTLCGHWACAGDGPARALGLRGNWTCAGARPIE